MKTSNVKNIARLNYHSINMIKNSVYWAIGSIGSQIKAVTHCLSIYCRVCTTMTNHHLPRDANKTFALTSSPNSGQMHSVSFCYFCTIQFRPRHGNINQTHTKS